MMNGQQRHCVIPSRAGGPGTGHREIARWGFPADGFASGPGTASCSFLSQALPVGALPSPNSKGQLQSCGMLQPRQLLPCAAVQVTRAAPLSQHRGHPVATAPSPGWCSPTDLPFPACRSFPGTAITHSRIIVTPNPCSKDKLPFPSVGQWWLSLKWREWGSTAGTESSP